MRPHRWLSWHTLDVPDGALWDLSLLPLWQSLVECGQAGGSGCGWGLRCLRLFVLGSFLLPDFFDFLGISLLSMLSRSFFFE